MIWLAWRQHRTQILVTTALLAAFGGLLLVNAQSVSGLLDGRPPGPDGGQEWRDFGLMIQDHARPVTNVLLFVEIVPALIGMFWGAPVLAGEFDRGTHCLAWTQTVPRLRWLATKLGLLAIVVTLSGLAVGLMTSAWLDVHGGTRVGNRFEVGGPFTASGVVPAAWWLFAFVLGVAVGVYVRKLVAAMVVTLVLFLVVLAGLAGAGRNFYAPPTVADFSVTPHAATADDRHEGPGLGAALTGPGGTEVSDEEFDEARVVLCTDAGVESTKCLKEAGYNVVQYMQPADRYWRFQWTETAVLFALAAALGVFVLRRIVRLK